MADDPRLEALQGWLASVRRDMAGPVATASADASARRYFRVALTDGSSAIAMDAPPDREDTHPFVDVARRLAEAGINVPRILAWAPEQGFVLMSDLGRESYLEGLADPARAPALMEAAVDALVTMQARTDTTGLPAYDGARLADELDLFPEWYVRRHLAIEPGSDWWSAWSELRDTLIERALAQPTAFVHRDYMARNLMVTSTPPGVLDFQDALSGPLTYDLASLLRDAFVAWPAARERHWVERYHAAARAAGLAVPESVAVLETQWRWMAMQRHLKVLGIFARLRYRDGKPHYLDDAPRFLGYLDEQARWLELAQWRAVIDPLAPERAS